MYILNNKFWSVVFLVSIFAFSEVWYVSPKGDDKNEGSEKSPFLTIQKAADQAQAGDIVFVKEGVYRERVAPPRGGAPSAPIIYKAEPGKNVILKGSEIWKPQWRRAGSLYVALPDDAMFDDDHYIDNKNPFLIPLSCTPYGRDGKPEVERGRPGNPDLVYVMGAVFVNGKVWKQVPFRSEAEKEIETWWVDRDTGEIYLHFQGPPFGQQVEITVRRRVFAPHKRGLGYIHLDGFVLEHGATQYPTDFWVKEKAAWQQAGIVGTRSGHHWEIRNCTIRHTLLGLDFGFESMHDQARGDLERGENGKAIIPAGFHTIISNRITDCFGPGTAGVSAIEMKIIGNIIERNNTMGFTGYKRYETAGLKMHHADNSIIKGNLVRNNPLMPGIWFDGGAGKNTVVAGNILTGNRKGFDLEIGDEAKDNLLVACNVVINNQRNGLNFRESGGVWTYGNFIVGSEYGYHQEADMNRGGKWSAREHKVTGNIIGSTKFLVSLIPHNFKDDPYKFGGRYFDYNVYIASETEGFFRIPSVGPFTFSIWKSNLTQWNQAENIEKHSVCIPDFAYQYDEETTELTLTIPRNMPIVKEIPSRYPYDFFGQKRLENSVAGPFPNLPTGKHKIKLWRGIESIGPYDLPWGGTELTEE